MSIISKTLAQQVSYKLVAKSKAKVDELKKEYEEVVTRFYEAQTPKAVKECYKKNPEWFNDRSTVNFRGHGFNWESVTTTRRIICNGGTNANLELTPEIAKHIVAAKNKYEKAQEEYKQLRSETENALLALKTFKNIREHLPEAAPHLPPPISNALVVNFDSLKKKLERQPTVSSSKVAV
jgi:hypothetical protein